MAKIENFESINDNFDELKTLINDIKENMMNSEDCNNQFYNILQTIDSMVTSLENIANEKSKPSDEFTILQTNVLEVRNELSKMNKNIDEVICDSLKDILVKLSEKVNRLEILTNNAGIDQQVVMNVTGQVEKSLSVQLKESSDILYAQGLSSADSLRTGLDTINSNMRECVEYLEKSFNTSNENTAQHISDDLTVLGTTIEKTNDNLKRSIIDLFTRIQEDIRGISKGSSGNSSEASVSEDFNKDFEMLKNGIYNLNLNTEQRIARLSQLVSELDVFKKMEMFSKLKDLPAIGDLKHTLENNINRIVDMYSYTLQSSQNRDELNKASQEFRKEIYNEILSMLSNVSEYLVENDDTLLNQLNSQSSHSSDLDVFAEKLDELTSVTELNNSGYDNIQIELKDLREKNNEILETLIKNKKATTVDETLNEIKNNIEEIRARGESLRKQSSEVSDVIKECTQSIIEFNEPANNTIKDMLSDIKKNISILQSGDEETDYTYSMQDIESDVAKIRIYLNELSQNGISVNTEEFSDELNSVVVMVDSMKQQLNKIDECDISDTMDKLKEDVTSISTRVNKLLLTSDNSYSIIEKSLKEFRGLSEEIDGQIKLISASNKFKSIEDNLLDVKTALSESNNYNSIINQSLIMLAEWVDSAGETITNISERLESLNELESIKSELASIPEPVDYNAAIKSLEESISKQNERLDEQQSFMIQLDEKLSAVIEQNERIEKQEERLNKLDEKLNTILEFTAKNDTSDVMTKMNDIDTKMEKLNKSIERLTSYVNEE